MKQLRDVLALAALSVGLLSPAIAQIASTWDEVSLSFAMGEARYQAREISSSGGTLNTEQGRLPTLTVAGKWQHGPWSAEASHLLARQDLAYQGYTQIGIPLSTTTRLALGNTALRAGYVWRVSEHDRLTLLGGVEHLQIDRQIQPALGALPLHETLNLLRCAAGVQWMHGGDLGFNWTAGVDLLRSVRSRLKVDTYGLFDPITLRPGAGNDWRAHVQAAYRWQGGLTMTVRASKESIRPGASSREVWTLNGVPAVSVSYPGSKQSLTGLHAGLTWRF